MAKEPVLSVIIGIRDWELARLRVAINSHQSCTMADEVEVVISDYGSQNHAEVEKLAAELGCTYVYTDDALWSRSRALNAGIVASSGEFILGTDADIIFAPETHAITVRSLRQHPKSLHLKQCRDLPESVTLDDLETTDWAYLDSIARTRPRWGMGGLAACRRDMADKVRGYDERMVVWGAEDNDFGKRLQAAGAILNWMTDKDCQIYHVWHPPFMQTHPKAREIFEKNKTYLNDDSSIIRNLATGCIYRGLEPLVSVVIATQNRAELLRNSIQSVLDQSFGEFELIVIDDGSADHTQDVLKSFTDPRIKRLRNEVSVGVGAARNIANATARGHYIVVHEDGDLMMPQRLEQQLGAIEAGVQGVYGSSVDFDTKSFDTILRSEKHPFSLASIYTREGVISHSTLLLEKSLFDSIPYQNESLEGFEYNLFFCLAWNEVCLKHCNDFVTLHGSEFSIASQKPGNDKRDCYHATNSLFWAVSRENEIEELHREAESLAHSSVDLTSERLEQMMSLAPLDGLFEMVEVTPKKASKYQSNKDTVLIGQFAKGEFDIKAELHDAARPPASAARRILTGAREPEDGAKKLVASATGVNFLRDSGQAVDMPDQFGKEFAGFLSKKSNWIILQTNERGKLLSALEKVKDFLPDVEDIIMVSRNGVWTGAFENNPSLRAAVLSRKLAVSNINCELYGLKVVSR